jgi:hypothetical protein
MDERRLEALIILEQGGGRQRVKDALGQRYDGQHPLVKHCARKAASAFFSATTTVCRSRWKAALISPRAAYRRGLRTTVGSWKGLTVASLVSPDRAACQSAWHPTQGEGLDSRQIVCGADTAGNHGHHRGQ